MNQVKNLLLLLLLTPSLISLSQNTTSLYQNEWINYQETYYKFQTTTTGIHRIAFETLQNAGIPLEGNQFILYSNGQQIPIYVNNEGTFQTGDFIEFYGQKNDGALDALLFENPEFQVNPYYSLFSDQRTYYLTSSDSIEPLRIEQAPNNLNATVLPEAEPFFDYKATQEVTSTYHFGRPISPSSYFSFLGDFAEGEGWIGTIIKEGNDQTVKIPTPALYPEVDETEESVLVEVTLVGRNRSIGVYKDQQTEIWVNNQIYIKEGFQDFSLVNYNFLLRPSELETEPDFTGQPRTPILFKAFDGISSGFPYESKYSVANLSITYPRLFDFEGQNQFSFDLNLNKDRYLEITNFDHQSTALLYDLTDNKRIVPAIENDTVKFLLPNDINIKKHQFFLSNQNDAIHHIDHLESKIFTNYSTLAEQGNFIIITNDSLSHHTVDPVKRYQQYRSSVEGGQHNVAVINVEELYEQFAWGIEQHPLAIQGFVNFAVNHWTIQPEFLLLLGKSVSYDKARNQLTNRKANLVPSYGQTPSDCIMVSPFDHNDYRPLLATSRLPVQTPEQIHHYLDKLIDYEQQLNFPSCNIKDRAWQKQILHVAKGWGQDQTDDFQEAVDDYQDYYQEGPSGMQLVTTLTDNFGPPTSGNDTPFFPAPQFADAMNNGLAMLTYFGHGLTSYWQYEISSNPNDYDNEGSYPFILSAACSVGDIHKAPGNETMVEDYILAEKAGTIAFAASTSLSSAYYIDVLSGSLNENLMQTHYGASIAQNIRQTILDLYSSDNISVKKVCSEFLVVGDPAVELYNWDKPEFVLEESTWEISESVAYGENINLNGILYNLGRVTSDSVELALFQKTPDNQKSIAWSALIPCPDFADTLSFEIPVKQHLAGQNTFTLKVNPQETFAEDCYDNNAFQQQIELLSCEPNCPEAPIIDNPIIESPDSIQSSISNLSINEHTEIVSVFPNPSNGLFNIKAKTVFLVGIQVFDESGKRVLFNQNMRQRELMIDLSPLPKGIYFVEASTELGVETKRIVLE